MTWFKDAKPYVITKKDYPINDIHEKIDYLFESEKKELEATENRIKILRDIISNGYGEDPIIAQNELRKLQKKYNRIKSDDIANEYKNKAQPFLDKYQKLKRKRIGYGMVRNDKDKNYDERIKIVAEYIKFCKRFIPIDDYAISILLCENCYNKIDRYQDVCNYCKTETDDCNYLVPDQAILFTQTRESYDPKDNFIEVMNRFEGNGKTKPPLSVNGKIRNYLDANESSKVSKSKFRIIMKKLGLGLYYYDLNYLYQCIYGDLCPDLSEIRDEILKRDEIYMSYYIRYKDEERKNTQHAHYKLYMYIVQCGKKVDEENFSNLITRDAIIAHNQITKILCGKIQKDYPNMNWKFVERT